MAMNKTEQAAFENLKRQLSLRITPEVKPDLLPPSHGEKDFNAMTKGFAISGTGDYASVEPACSSSIYHAVGRDDKTTTQNSIAIFSTKILALRALRNQVEKNCANQLYKIDLMIEEENTKSNA